ncbi:uncharacterized protein Tco025E_09550, partial [Trypanosoma conorhini]
MRLWQSQTRAVERLKAAGLPAVDEMRRFRLLVCCLFCSICTSLVYAFDLFTTQFVERFHLSVGDQSTISTVGLVFCYFTLPYGFLYDYAGPFPLILICVVTGGLGSLLLGLTFDGFIPGNVTNFSVFYAMMNTCAGLIETSYILTLVEAFPRNLGPVIALAKVLTGLGSSVLASVSVNLFGDNISGFIYAIMAYSVVVCGVAAFVVVLPPYFVNGWRRRGKSEEQLAAMRALAPAYRRKFVPVRRLGVGYVVVALLLVFFTVQAPVVSYTKVSSGASIALGVITIALVLCFFLMLLPVRWLGGMDGDAEEEPGRANAAEEESLPVRDNKAGPDPADTELLDIPKNWPDNGPDEAANVSDVDSGVPQAPRYGGSVWDNLKR